MLRRALAYLFLTVAPSIVYAAATPRIAVLTIISPERLQFKGLKTGLHEFGYSEGKNILLDMKQRKDLAELKTAARAFVEERYDVLVASGSRETAIAQKLTRDIPIIFMPAIDPVKSGFVKSYSRSETNLTGLSYFRDPEDNGKLLELFNSVVPKLGAVTLLTDGRSNAEHSSTSSAAIRKVALKNKIKFAEKPVRTISEAMDVISVLSPNAQNGVLVVCSTLFAQVKDLARHAREKNIPLYGCSRPQVAEDGALFSYAPDLYEMGRRAAWYVDRILKGAKPQELPVETPRKFEFVINLRTAKEIGLRIAPEILQRADKVIE